MAIDLEKYINPPQLTGAECNSHETDSFFTRGGFIGFVRALIQRWIEWWTVKYLFVALLTLLGFSIPWADSERIAEDLASGRYFGAIKQFFTHSKLTSQVANAHPFYKSDAAKEIEEYTGKSLKKLFWVIKYKDQEGKTSTLLLMREPVRDGKTGKFIKADKQAFIFTDANEICEDYGGGVPSSDIVKQGAKIINMIKRPEGTEMFSDSEKEEGFFRCFIDPRNYKRAT